MQPKGSMFEGKTLDDAVKKGLQALGLSRAEVMITVLEEGSSGFLGIGARPYKVRMMPRPMREERERPQRHETRGRDRNGPAARRGRPSPRGERREERRSGPRDAERRHAPERRAEGRGAQEPEATRPEPSQRGSDDDESRRRRRRGRRGGRGRRGEGMPEREAAPRGSEPEAARGRRPESVGATTHLAEHEAPETPDMGSNELAALGQRVTGELLQAMGFDAKITAQAEGTSVEVAAEVRDDEELLTGKKGEVRQALQHLLNRMINRGGGSRYHLQLEINQFWQQRENELRDLARSLADEALQSGGEKLTEYLNAQERRIVHITLKDDGRVKTYAIGDGLIKKVAVAPADYPEPSQAET